MLFFWVRSAAGAALEMKMAQAHRPFTRVAPVSGRWLGAFLLGVFAVYGCGRTERAGAGPVAGAPSVTTPSAGANAGGTGPTPVVDAGAGGEPVACGRVAVPAVPVVDAAVSGRYRWDECGRIAPGKGSHQALVANDGSILSADDDDAVRGYVNGVTTPDTLIDAGTGAGSLVLSNDGALLLLSNATGAHVYRSRTTGEAINAQSGMLEEQLNIDTVSQGCGGSATFSADNQLVVAFSGSQMCAWQTTDGKLVANIALPVTVTDTLTLVAAEAGGSVITLLHDKKLSRYSLAGELLTQHDLPGFTSETPLFDAVFSADARSLVVVSRNADGDGVLAADVASGALLWQRSFTAFGVAQLSASRDGYVLARELGVFRIADGEKISDDAPTYNHGFSAGLGLGGAKKVIPGPQLAEWDETKQTLLRLYGGHARRIVALDISADGRYLASHDGKAIVWQIDDAFAQSIPLYWGSAPDSSWNVALSHDGGALVASGDNVARFQRDGAFQPADPPPPGAGSCLSADWAFSPDGCWVAGTHYGQQVVVRDAQDFSVVTTLPASNCAGGVAFSPDGAYLMTASLELFDTSTWRTQWSLPLAPSTNRRGAGIAENAVQFSPDGKEVIITTAGDGIDDDVYSSVRHNAITGQTIANVPQLSGDRVRYSPEQHWLVSRNFALHLPSGSLFELSGRTTEALFTPQGDIIAGEADGSLVRYCRSSR